jgi:hypothetical protein
MGLQNLLGIISSDLSTEEQVKLHLTSNCYPPVPESFHPACLLAIKLCSDQKSEVEVSLPDGVDYQGKGVAPAGIIVKNFHLDLFVDYGEDDDG